MIRKYLDFTLRPYPTHPTLTGFEVLPEFANDVFVRTLFFFFIFWTSGWFVRKLWPKWYASLPSQTKREFSSHCMGTVHHIYVVWIGISHIVQDLYLTEEELQLIHFSLLDAHTIAFMIAYLIADIICYALPEWWETGSIAFLLHHLVGIWLGFGVMGAAGHILRCTSHLNICEFPNIFLNLSWFMKLFWECQSHPIITFCEAAFAIFFFFTRVINLPLHFYQAYTGPYAPSVMYGAQVTIFPIIGLQYFWFYKILEIAFSRKEAVQPNGKLETSEPQSEDKPKQE